MSENSILTTMQIVIVQFRPLSASRSSSFRISFPLTYFDKSFVIKLAFSLHFLEFWMVCFA